jgi:phosphatidylglycerophosphate synthase
VAGIPNFLSSLRLGFVPVLLILSYTGHAEIFLACLVISLLTDALDGFIARRLHATSEIGAKLDSLADLATCLAMPPCAWWLRPEVLREEIVAIVAALLFYATAQIAGLIKFRRLPSYHTCTAKVVASLAAVAFVVIFANGPGWILRILAPLVALACAEEIAITLTLRTWQPDVPSYWHAWKLRNKS